MPRNYWVNGDWNAICDCCGFKFKASQLRKDWKGEYRCMSCWETRHPQELLRVPKDDPSVPWARPDDEDPEEVFICWIWMRSAYADLGTADCMRADYTPQTYQVLLEMAYPPFPTPQPISHSAIPLLLIPGIAWPNVID